MFSSRPLPLPDVFQGGGLCKGLWHVVWSIPAWGDHPPPRLSQTCGRSPRYPQCILIHHPAPNAVPQPPAPRAGAGPKYLLAPKAPAPQSPRAWASLSHHPQPGGIPAPRHLSSHPPMSAPVPKPRGSINPEPPRCRETRCQETWLHHGGHRRAGERRRPPHKGAGAAQGSTRGEVGHNPEGVQPGTVGKIPPGKVWSWIQPSRLSRRLKVFSVKPPCGTVWHVNTKSATARGSRSPGPAPEGGTQGSEFYFSNIFSISGAACPDSSLLLPLK